MLDHRWQEADAHSCDGTSVNPINYVMRLSPLLN